MDADHAQCDDAALMERIGRMRDREAFAQLFTRHQQAAYNMAWHLTRNSSQAEEAVQEAMLRVWIAAPEYQSIGAVRNWILKIVVRESLRLNRERQSERSRLMRKQEQEPRAEAEAHAQTQEQSEIMAALRGCLERLDTSSRELLALYFGAGMTQEEIAETLAMQQTTVSRRIQQLLKDLKTQLAQAGCAAAVPLLTKGGLKQIFCEGVCAPPGLQAKVLGRLGQEAVRLSRRVAAVKAAGGSGGVWLAVPLLAAAAVAAVFALQPGPAATTPAISEPLETLEAAYSDDFEAPELNAFWTAPELPKAAWTRQAGTVPDGRSLWQPRPEARTAQGLTRTRLELCAWAQTWAAPPGTLDAVHPEAAGPPATPPGAEARCELLSRLIAMPATPLYLGLDAYPPAGGGRFAYGMELLDQTGRSVYRQGYAADTQPDGRFMLRAFLEVEGQAQPTDYQSRVEDEPEPFSFIGALTLGQPGAPSSAGTQDARRVRTQFEGVTALRLKFFATAEPGGWVRWPIDRISLGRAPIAEPVFRNAWDFSAGPAPELSRDLSAWTWERPDPRQPGFMRTPPVAEAPYEVLRLPGVAPRAPFKITLQARMPAQSASTGKSNLDGFWVAADSVPRQRYWLNNLTLTPGHWETITIYFFGKTNICYVGQKLMSVREAPREYPSRRVFLSLRGMEVRSIATEPLDAATLAPELKKPELLTRTMEHGPLTAPATEFVINRADERK